MMRSTLTISPGSGVPLMVKLAGPRLPMPASARGAPSAPMVSVRSAPAKLALPELRAPERSAALRLAPRKSVWLRLAPVSTASNSRALRRLAPLRLAPSRIAPLRLAPLRSAPLKSTPVRSAPTSTPPARLAPTKLESMRMVSNRRTPARLAPVKMLPVRSLASRRASRRSALAKLRLKLVGRSTRAEPRGSSAFTWANRAPRKLAPLKSTVSR